MKSNSKGFTLIELLAVIVILAVIALIATPLIMGVIDDARKGSAKNGAYGYVKAMENTIATEMIKDTTISPSAIQTNVGQVMFTKRMNNGNIASAGSRVMNYKGTKPERHNLNIIDGTVGNGSCIVISGYGFQMNHNEWEEINVGECKENSNGNIIVDVKEGMIPVTFDSSGNTVVADTTKEWYNYDEKKWANAVSVTSASRSNYLISYMYQDIDTNCGMQKMEFQTSKQSILNLRRVVKTKRMERKMENG